MNFKASELDCPCSRLDGAPPLLTDSALAAPVPPCAAESPDPLLQQGVYEPQLPANRPRITPPLPLPSGELAATGPRITSPPPHPHSFLPTSVSLATARAKFHASAS